MSEVAQNPSAKLSKQAKKPTNKRVGKSKGGGGGCATSSAAKQRPMRVVHISNPMRFQTSASEFRDLVQGLTGRHAAEWPDIMASAGFNKPCTSLDKRSNNNDDHVDVPDVFADVEVDNDEETLLVGGGQPVGYEFGSDLMMGCFEPFDVSVADDYVRDRMVVVEDFSSFYR